MSILQSCSKDTYSVVDSKSQDGKITFEMLKQQIGQPSLEKKVVISTNKNSNKSYSFTIDTTSIKKLTRERVVYSMVVSPNFIEDTIRNYNLLYFEKNGKMQQLLIKFVPTTTWEVNYKKGIKRPFEGKMIAVSDYNLSKGTSKSTSQGELAICYQTNPIWLCNCANHRLGDPQCTCDTGFSVNTETTIVPCELSGGGGSDPTSGDTGYGGGSLNPDGSTFNPDYPVFDDINYINKLKTNYFWYNLGDARRDWVNSKDTTNDIYAKLINYQIEQNWTIASSVYSLWAIEFFQENTEVTWDEFKETLDYLKISTDPLKTVIAKNWLNLKKELLFNSALLLKIPCNEIPKWQELIQFTPPQSVKNKIQILNNQSIFTDYKIQYLEHAKGAAINLDYFPVTINSLPTNPNTGQKFTPKEFLNYVRLNINSFVNTSISSFSPTTLNTGYNESQIWNSTNPLGAIIHINIPLPAGDGSVICSETDSNHWIFTTIKVPWKPTNNNADGIHPVSGNREFGLIANSNGTYTF